jgi:hypothetical protein
MIWFYLISSTLFALIGLILFFAPHKILFLMSSNERNRLMDGRTFRVVSRIGGVLILFVCLPLNLIIGFLLDQIGGG